MGDGGAAPRAALGGLLVDGRARYCNKATRGWTLPKWTTLVNFFSGPRRQGIFFFSGPRRQGFFFSGPRRQGFFFWPKETGLFFLAKGDRAFFFWPKETGLFFLAQGDRAFFFFFFFYMDKDKAISLCGAGSADTTASCEAGTAGRLYWSLFDRTLNIASCWGTEALL